MKNTLFLLLFASFSLSAQIRDVGSNPAAFSVAIDNGNYSSPSGCTNTAMVIAHEINVLNPDFSIAAFAYVDLTSGFIHSSDTAIVEANVDGSFDINDASFTDYRTRVAQSCKMGCCHKTVKWTDWVYSSNVPLAPKNPTIEQLNINCSSACTAFINYIEFCEPAPIPDGAVTVGIDLYLNGTNLIENLEANSALGGQISDGTIASELTVGDDYSILLYYLDVDGNSVYSQSFALADSLNNACLPCNTTPEAITNDDPQGLLTVGNQYLLNVTLNDSYLNCAPVTFGFGSLLNCTVTSNGDGTFNVTPLSDGDWSFTYTATCSDKTTIGKASVVGTAST